MADAEQTLRNFLNKIAVEQNYVNNIVNIKPISSDGANYTTKLFLATISAPGKVDIELFAKVANLGQSLRDKINVDRLFKIEHRFYSDILIKYKKLEIDHEVPEEYRIAAAKFYLGNMKNLEETIVLENLSAKGFMMFDRFKSINWEYGSKAIEELVKLHSLSFALGETNFEEFNKILKEVEYDVFDKEGAKKIKAIQEVMLATAVNATADKNRSRLNNFINKVIDANKYVEYRKPMLRPTIIHGDFRHSNLMHKNTPDGNLDVVIIDYQTLQAGCPIMDLLYFIFNCSDEEFRREYFDKLVEHYYTQLRLALQRLHVDPDKVYPREDFEYELKEMLPFGLSIGVFTLQIVTVEAANAPKLDGDLSEFSVKTSDLFAERLNGIVNDYIRWGIL